MQGNELDVMLEQLSDDNKRKILTLAAALLADQQSQCEAVSAVPV